MKPGSQVNPALIRRLNIARVFHAVRRAPGASQRKVAELTGLDKATVSTIVAALVDEGLLARSTVATGKPGRPEQALRVDEEAGVLVGARVELGSVRLLVATLGGEPLATRDIAVDATPDAAVDALDDGIRALLSEAGRTLDHVRAVGVGVPALFDREGRLSLAPNLGWRDVPFGPDLAKRFPVPVYVDNDTKAAGLAETLFGRYDDLDDFVYVAGHSGIGGALYLGGRLYRGHDGFAGELGHLKVRPGGRPCGCGARGCLEAYVSERALLSAADEAGLAVTRLDELVAADEAGDELAGVRGQLQVVLTFWRRRRTSSATRAPTWSTSSIRNASCWAAPSPSPQRACSRRSNGAWTSRPSRRRGAAAACPSRRSASRRSRWAAWPSPSKDSCRFPAGCSHGRCTGGSIRDVAPAWAADPVAPTLAAPPAPQESMPMNRIPS